MDYKELSTKILTNVGGFENVKNVTHCATRLRFTLNDFTKVDQVAVEALDGVLGSVQAGGQFQIIIGQTVGRAYAEVQTLLGTQTLTETETAAVKTKPKKVNQLLDTITGIFTPFLPAITACAMIKTLLIILDLGNWLNTDGTTYQMLTFIGDTAFYFIPVLIAFSASKKFSINPYLGAVLGLMLVHPTFASMVSEGKTAELFGFLPVTLATYSSTVIPIILIIWLASYVDKFSEKIIPDAVKFFLKPTVTLLIMIPIAFVVVGPLGYIAGKGLEIVLNQIQDHAIWIIPLIFGALSPIFIMTGMHYAVTIPLVLTAISSQGYDMLGVGFLVSNIAQGAAAMAVGYMSKNKGAKSIAFSTGFTALLGVTEPAMYGVNLKWKKPFYAVVIAGGITGLIAGITGVKRMSFAPTGLTTLPIFIDSSNPSNFIFAIVCCAASFVIAFILTCWFLKRDKNFKESMGGVNE